MKSCFEYFLNVDLTDWNYRVFPVTKIRKQIIACSRDINIRFGLFLYKIQETEMRRASKFEIFCDWTTFVDEEGVVHYRRDSNYVCAMLELSFDPEKHGDDYILEKTKLRETLVDLCGEDILPVD